MIYTKCYLVIGIPDLFFQENSNAKPIAIFSYVVLDISNIFIVVNIFNFVNNFWSVHLKGY